MESIRKKAGYLEGLLTAMKLDENDPETHFRRGIVSLLSDLAERVEAADDMLGELNDYVESIDDDLSELEGMHDDDEDEDDFDFDVYPAHDEEEPLRLIKNESAAPEKVMLPVRCTECATVFLISGAPDSGKYICPVCHKTMIPQRLSVKNTPVGKSAED